MTARVRPAVEMSERDLTAGVMQIAHLYGWLCCHFRPARRADGSWVTPLQGDGAGFPDLVLVRPPRIIFAELKAHGGRLMPLQHRWLDTLGQLDPPVETYVWTPTQLAHDILEALQ